MFWLIILNVFLCRFLTFYSLIPKHPCCLGPSRPGLFKDLKTMGSISLFIFFITLFVLARQVGPNIII